MNASLHSMVETLGWALLHFLWIGTAVAVILWLLLLATRKASPQIRYLASSVALGLMLVGFLGSVALNWQMPVMPKAPVKLTDLVDESYMTNAASVNDSVAETRSPMVALETPPAVAAPTVPASAPPLSVPVAERLRPALPWCVAVWALGVLVFSLRFFTAWRAVQKWRASGTSSISSEWQARFAALCERLKISRTVELLASTAVAVPVVIGWLNPVILLPAGLFAGLTPAQLEAVLAHELAHVRRHDYLVNLLQNVVETIFFFHPAVWWTSAQLRKEREHCCDDIAASLTGEPIDYARALASLETLRNTPALSLSATDGSLLPRVRRIIGLPQERTRVWPLGLLAVIALALAIPMSISMAALKEEGRPAPLKNEQSKAQPEPNSVRIYKEPGNFWLTKNLSLRILEFPMGKAGHTYYDGISVEFIWNDDRHPPSNAAPKIMGINPPMHLGKNFIFVWKEGGPSLWLINDGSALQLEMTENGEIRATPTPWGDVAKKQAIMPTEVWESVKLRRRELDIDPPPNDHYLMFSNLPVVEKIEPKGKSIFFTESGETILDNHPMTDAEIDAYVRTNAKSSAEFHTLVPHPKMPMNLFGHVVDKLMVEKVKFGILATHQNPMQSNSGIGDTALEPEALNRGWITLPNPKYQPITAPAAEALASILWATPIRDHMRIGISVLPACKTWHQGSKVNLKLYLRNDGDRPQKLSWTSRIDDGLVISLTDSNGIRHLVSIKKRDQEILSSHNELQPGQTMEVKSIDLEIAAKTPNQNDDYNAVAAVNDGSYTLVVNHRMAGFTTKNGKSEPVPNEWVETAETPPLKILITQESEAPTSLEKDAHAGETPPPHEGGAGLQPVNSDAAAAPSASDPSKAMPTLNTNISPEPASIKADGRDAHATYATPAVNIAREAGDYSVADGIKLHIIQIASDHGVQNRAVIKWSDRDGKVFREHSFNLAHGTNVDPILWRTGSPVFWVVYGNTLRKFDYTNPQNARESSDSNTAVSGGMLEGPAEIRAIQEEIRLRQTNDVPVICGLSMQGIRKHSDIMDQGWMADYYDPKSKSGMPRDNVIFFGLDHLSSGAGGPNAGPWVYFLPGADHFHIKIKTEPFGSREVIYGPIPGHPVDVLHLSDWLRKSLIYRDAQKAGWMTEKLLISSDEKFARLGMERISQFPAPTSPRQYQSLVDALRTNLKRNPPAAFAAALQDSLDKLNVKTSAVAAAWDEKRVVLPDSAYTQGKPFPSPQDLKITWGRPAANGLRIGFSGVDEKTHLKSDDRLMLHIYVRNDGLLPVMFATSTANNFLYESLIDLGGNQHQAQWPGLCHMAFLNPLRFSLEPGHFIQIGEESLLLFQQEKGGLIEPKTEGKFFRIPKQGAYQLLVEARFEEDDLAAEDGRVINVAPKGQWRGRLDASLHSLEITSDGTGVPPVSPDAPATGPTPDPSKCEPSPSSNDPSAKADGRDAHATKPSATGR